MQPQGTAQSLDRAAGRPPRLPDRWPPARSSRCRSSSSIIFSTNLDPKDLVDDAFLRRIRHKVEIDAPSRDVYEKIFNAMCQEAGHEPAAPRPIDYLYERYYTQGRTPAGQRLSRFTGDRAVDLPI